jgi:hypothetical protein
MVTGYRGQAAVGRVDMVTFSMTLPLIKDLQRTVAVLDAVVIRGGSKLNAQKSRIMLLIQATGSNGRE